MVTFAGKQPRTHLRLWHFSNIQKSGLLPRHCRLKSHRITMLRSQAETQDGLKGIWPGDTKLDRQTFDRLRRASLRGRK